MKRSWIIYATLLAITVPVAAQSVQASLQTKLPLPADETVELTATAGETFWVLAKVASANEPTFHLHRYQAGVEQSTKSFSFGSYIPKHLSPDTLAWVSRSKTGLDVHVYSLASDSEQTFALPAMGIFDLRASGTSLYLIGFDRNRGITELLRLSLPEGTITERETLGSSNQLVKFGESGNSHLVLIRPSEGSYRIDRTSPRHEVGVWASLPSDLSARLTASTPQPQAIASGVVASPILLVNALYRSANELVLVLASGNLQSGRAYLRVDPSGHLLSQGHLPFAVPIVRGTNPAGPLGRYFLSESQIGWIEPNGEIYQYSGTL